MLRKALYRSVLFLSLGVFVTGVSFAKLSSKSESDIRKASDLIWPLYQTQCFACHGHEFGAGWESLAATNSEELDDALRPYLYANEGDNQSLTGLYLYKLLANDYELYDTMRMPPFPTTEKTDVDFLNSLTKSESSNRVDDALGTQPVFENSRSICFNQANNDLCEAFALYQRSIKREGAKAWNDEIDRIGSEKPG